MLSTKNAVIGFLILCAYGHASVSWALSTSTYYHNDELGSLVTTTSEAGDRLSAPKPYHPYGDVAHESSSQPIGYSGKMEDQETGLVYMNARYYDARIGRFISTDPMTFIEGGDSFLNRYVYANNNPYKYVDPTGEHAVLTVVIGGGLGAFSMYRWYQDARAMMDFRALYASGGIRPDVWQRMMSDMQPSGDLARVEANLFKRKKFGLDMTTGDHGVNAKVSIPISTPGWLPKLSLTTKFRPGEVTTPEMYLSAGYDFGQLPGTGIPLSLRTDVISITNTIKNWGSLVEKLSLPAGVQESMYMAERGVCFSGC